MNVLPVCKPVYHICAWCQQGAEAGAGSPRTGVMDVCELPCGYWELNPGPLQQDQQVLLTTEHPSTP